MVDELNYLWDEYKYRHERWSAVYKVTAAVVTLEVVPNPKDELIRQLGHWMFVPALMGGALAAFGIRLLSNEGSIRKDKGGLSHPTE